MHLFYVPDIQSGFLPEDESRHAVKVLRLQSGSTIAIVDGVGGYHTAEITLAHPAKCGFQIVESVLEVGKRNYRLHIAMAPTKNIERFEWFIEKATEIGIDSVIPLLCHHSERKVIKHERLEKVIVSAAKQSLKAYFPVLRPLTTFNDLLKEFQHFDVFIAHCYESTKTHLRDVIKTTEDILILIGPEGDFSRDEVEKAIAAGAVPVSLGESRLRTETAGVMACSAIAIFK